MSATPLSLRKIINHADILHPQTITSFIGLPDMHEITAILEKYNKPVPRYTSYPTVPFWYDFKETQTWETVLQREYAANKTQGIALYIHLPFCESLCTYCGCNKKITTNHSVEDEYISAVLAEWRLYCQLLGEKPIIRELHLGGGTPTFFNPANLEKLLTGIFKNAIIHPRKEFSFEGHPNNTTLEHLTALYNLGFTRVSYGVQDDDAVVQKAINRIQSFANVVKATENARAVGYKSVNFDLIYGLPFQTIGSMQNTFNKVISLQPERIAFYSYAHVPWKQKAQRLFDETNLPEAHYKTQLYLQGKTMLTAAGYIDIGMDHFALPSDDLFIAWKSKHLHRNFMGYTTTSTNFLLGLGVSAISDVGRGYAQNAKELEHYYRSIKENKLPVNKGYFLSNEDVIFKKYILDIACNGETTLDEGHTYLLEKFTTGELEKLEGDGLVNLQGQTVKVTKTGRQFIRNICNAFDLCAHENALNNDTKVVFSKAV